MKLISPIKQIFSIVIMAMSLGCMASGSKKPNILLILTDDHGYADVGFNNYKTDVETPNLDALANQGVVFTDAYVAHPFCGPSRAALMTGRYPHKIGSDFNLPVNGSSTGIDPKEEFISKTLKNNGYFTGAIGKWHLGEEQPYHPNNRGFDEFYGFLGGGHKFFPSEYRPQYERLKKQGITRFNDYITPLEYNGKEVRETEYITDALSREAVNFIGKAANDDKPFFLYLAYNAPHVPLEAKKEDLARFSHIKDKKRRTYAAMVWSVDEGVKRVVQSLKDTGQYENTLIVFMSDNGGKRKWGGVNLPLKEGKGSAHEGGHRVPMMMHWPAGFKTAGKYSYVASALDLYPTFASLAGAKLPPSKVVDGVDLSKHINARTDGRKGKSLFVMRHRLGAHDVSIRRDEWKAVRTKATGKWQLFNIVQDISEKNDLSQKHEMLLRDMVADMAHWSWSNVEPQWFHIHQEGDDWRDHNMPRYGETFKVGK